MYPKPWRILTENPQCMNEGLVRKCNEGRRNKTKKYFGTAHILSMEEALRKEKRKAKEQQAMDEKEERATLWGLVGLGKMDLNETPFFHRGLNPIVGRALSLRLPYLEKGAPVGG